MEGTDCLFVQKEAVRRDPALQPGARGARKVVVTSLYKTEEEATSPVWEPPAQGELCPVVVAENWEMPFFTEGTTQDRHYHIQATEIYSVLSGTMKIKVNDEEYALREGDFLVVMPGAVHEVIREGEFLAMCLVPNCGGADDKFVVD